MKITGILFFCMGLVLLAHAQNSKPLLKVGDKAPEMNPFKWIQGEPFDFHNDQIYLVEFGATWCSPCAAAIPELNELAQQYKEKVTVLSVFVMEVNDSKKGSVPSYVSKVESYVKKRAGKMNYTIAVDGPAKEMETAWLSASALTGIPYLFVIDTKGNIASISSDLKETHQRIKQLLNNGSIPPEIQPPAALSASDPYRYNQKELLLINENGGKQDQFYFRSILTAYNGRIRTSNPFVIQSSRWGPADSVYNYLKDRIQLIDVSVADLYFYAYKDTLFNIPTGRNFYQVYSDTIAEPHKRKSYGKQWHVPVLEVNDSTPFLIYSNRLANRFNYSLKVPKGAGSAKFLQECMRKDLGIYFDYKARVEVRNMPYWKVEVNHSKSIKKLITGNEKKEPYKTAFDGEAYTIYNGELRDLIWMLGANFGFEPYGGERWPKDQQLAFIDHTGIQESITFRFDKKWSLPQLQEYLNTVGLKVTKAFKPMTVVVISD